MRLLIQANGHNKSQACGQILLSGSKETLTAT